MAQLNITPRRTERNPYPRSKPPLGFWSLDMKEYKQYVALRANGTFVSRTRQDGKWYQLTWHERTFSGWNPAAVRKLPVGAMFSQADALLIGLGWEHATEPGRGK